MGIEPTALAWEARVLPLYDAREERHFTRGWGCLAIRAFRRCVRFWGESLGIESHRGRILRFPLARFQAVLGLPSPPVPTKFNGYVAATSLVLVAMVAELVSGRSVVD